MVHGLWLAAGCLAASVGLSWANPAFWGAEGCGDDVQAGCCWEGGREMASASSAAKAALLLNEHWQ